MKLRARMHSAAELARVLVRLPAIELGRRMRAPADVLASVRASGARRPHRTPEQRRHLRHVISFVDGLIPDGGNCFRRVLLEMALDRGAAEDKVVFGLNAGGGKRSGHAWLAPLEPRGRYDVEFEA